jgi:hypothetical protein
VAVMVGFFGLALGAWRAGFGPELEPILLGAVGAVRGALVSGIFDHYWFNMTYPHMTVLLWLHIGLATATILVQRSRLEEDATAKPAQSTTLTWRPVAGAARTTARRTTETRA